MKIEYHFSVQNDYSGLTKKNNDNNNISENLPYFIPEYSSPTLSYENNYRIAKNNALKYWNATILCSKCNKIAFKILNGCDNMMIGISLIDIDKNGGNYNKSKGK